MEENILNKKESESQLEYFKRITDNRKELDLDYSEWVKLLIGKEYSSENARKGYYIVSKLLEVLEEEQLKVIPKNKMEEMQEILGEVNCKKQELRNKQNKLNKITRDFVKSMEIANDLKDFIQEEGITIEQFDYDNSVIEETEKKLIVCIGDWHIGYVINDYKGNYYNYDVAKMRLEQLLKEILKVCEQNNINSIVVCQLGDIIENTYMRRNQSYNTEFYLSEQINKAIHLLFGFLVELTNNGKYVTLYSVGGNHSRLADKDANVEGDNANVIINEMIKTFKELSNNTRLTIGETDYKDDSCYFNIDGLNVVALHGDNRPSEDKKLFDSENTLENNRNVDLILRGHFHNFKINSQNNGGYVVTNGCLFGYNPYSVKKMTCSTNASQTLIVVDNGNVDTIKNVSLQII